MNACEHGRIGLDGVTDGHSCTTECSLASETSPDYCQDKDSGNFCVCGAPGCSTRKVTNRHNMESDIAELAPSIGSTSTTNFPDQHQDTSKPKLGTYVIERTIGKGIFSSVKLAKHTITGIFVIYVSSLSFDFVGCNKNHWQIPSKSWKSQKNIQGIWYFEGASSFKYRKTLSGKHILCGDKFQVMETQRLLCMVMEYVSNGELFGESLCTSQLLVMLLKFVILIVISVFPCQWSVFISN